MGGQITIPRPAGDGLVIATEEFSCMYGCKYPVGGAALRARRGAAGGDGVRLAFDKPQKPLL